MSAPKVKVGIFGKIPSHGDFVSMGTASDTGRSFEKFCQMANDMVAQADNPLPLGPIGFCFRDGSGASSLIGVLVRSRDSAGRKFPLALFCEYSVAQDMQLAGAPGVFRNSIGALNQLALDAPSTTIDALKESVRGVPTPDPSTIVDGMKAEVARLADVPFRRIVKRVFGPSQAPALGTQTLLKACDVALREGARRPPTVDLRATSDVELLFWLACAESRLGSGFSGVSCFWDVTASRALLAPGMPDSNTLNFLTRSGVQFSKLWGVTAATQAGPSEARAVQSLDPVLVEMLRNPGATVASTFVEALSPATDPSQT